MFRPSDPGRQPQVVKMLSSRQIAGTTRALEEEVCRIGASYDGAACGSEIDTGFFRRIREIKTRYGGPQHTQRNMRDFLSDLRWRVHV
jgi:hypothetical protein